MSLSLQARVKKTDHGVETHSGKDNVLGTATNKGHADSLLRHERTHHLIFLKKVQL